MARPPGLSPTGNRLAQRSRGAAGGGVQRADGVERVLVMARQGWSVGCGCRRQRRRGRSTDDGSSLRRCPARLRTWGWSGRRVAAATIAPRLPAGQRRRSPGATRPRAQAPVRPPAPDPPRPPIVAAGPIRRVVPQIPPDAPVGGPGAVSPDRFPRVRRCRCRHSRRMPAVAVEPMRSTCRPAARRLDSFRPRPRARRPPGRRRWRSWRRRRGSRARTVVTERWQTRWAGNGRPESAGRQQCGSRVTKHFSLRFNHLRREEACRDGLEWPPGCMLPPGPSRMRAGGAEGGVR